MAGGPVAVVVAGDAGGCGGRGRRGGDGDDAQGLRHDVDGRHLVRVRCHGDPRLHVPPHGHLRAPHQAPRLPSRRLPRRRPPPPQPARRLSRQTPIPTHGGVGAAGGGLVGVDAGAEISDVPGAAGAAAAAVREGRCALAATRPQPPFLHAAMTNDFNVYYYYFNAITGLWIMHVN